MIKIVPINNFSTAQGKKKMVQRLPLTSLSVLSFVFTLQGHCLGENVYHS